MGEHGLPTKGVHLGDSGSESNAPMDGTVHAPVCWGQRCGWLEGLGVGATIALSIFEQINWTFYRKNIQISQEDLRILKAFAVILWVCCLGRPARGVCQRDALRATSCGHGTSTTVGHKCRHYRQGLVGQAGKPLGTMAATSVAST